MNYQKLVKAIREKMILSQDELARLLHVSFSTVNRWETGKFNPTMKMKKKLHNLFLKAGILEE